MIIILIGLMLFLITGFMVWTQLQSREQSSFSSAILDTMNSVVKVGARINSQVSDLKDFLLSGSEGKKESYDRDVRDVKSALAVWMTSVQSLINQDVGFNRTDLEQAENIRSDYESILGDIDEAIQFQANSQVENAFEVVNSGIEPRLNSLVSDQVSRALDVIKMKVGNAYTSKFADTSSMWKQGIQVLAIFCLLILLVSYRLLWSMFKAIDDLKKGAVTIGKGKFDHRISLDSKDELGQLAVSFNEMTENLQKTTISRDYVDNIIHSMHGSLIVTSPERYIQTINSSTCDMLGYNEDELRGMPLESIFASESAGLQKSLNELLEKGSVRYVESTYLRKDGGTIPVLFSASMMRGDEGEEQGIVLVSADITSRKEAEERQAQLLSELDSVNKELSDFAHIVSHDLKAPLRGIQSLSSWIVDDYSEKLGDEGKDQLQLLQTRTLRMQNLIDGVLHYSRVGHEQENKENVDLNQLVKDVTDSLSPPEHISISIDNPLPVVFGEPTRLGQLFQNLISNAVKYMDKEQGWVRIGCQEKDNFWKFSISDNGPGIENKHFEKIFQIFQKLQSRDDVEGTGIGLAVVKKIVSLYDGEIWVESELGKGTTFFFTMNMEKTEFKEE